MSRPGLAAWIVEKFHGWSDNDGDVESAFTKDEMLTNITLYWVTETITSSSRIYYESGHAPPTRPVGYIDVPTGVAIFPKEITFVPESTTSRGTRSQNCWWTTSVRSSGG